MQRTADRQGGKVLLEPENRKRAIGLKLNRISRQLSVRFSERVESVGISRAKWTVIAAVARNPGLTQRAIAGALGVTEVTAGRLIDRLCEDGFLKRKEHPQDRRAYCVYLTKAANPMLEKLGAVAVDAETEAFAGLKDSDLVKLETLLAVIERNLADARVKPEPESAGAASKKAKI